MQECILHYTRQSIPADKKPEEEKPELRECWDNEDIDEVL